ETLPQPAQESLWVSLRCASVSIGLEKASPVSGYGFPVRTGTSPGGRPTPRLGMDPWIIGAEGPHVALGILAGVVAPAVVLRHRLPRNLGPRGLTRTASAAWG